MKKLILLLFAIASAVSTMAQLAGDGYYRVQNTYTVRYIRIIDNTGRIDYSSTSVDLGSLVTIRNFANVVSDPSSIIYISNAGSGFDLYGQGCSTYSIIGYYLQIKENTGGGSYKCYATKSGLTKYLADEISSYDDGVVLTNSTRSRDWYIKPVNQVDTLCFGLQPEIQVNGKYYLSLYASFPFSFASEGMKAYYIKQANRGLAVYQQITSDVIPAATPVIIECSSNDPYSNKLNLLTSTATPPSDNLLNGVYFRNPSTIHYNEVANNTTTMRVLGRLSDGSLGFVKSMESFMPANKAYLTVSDNYDSYKFVSNSEYTTGIEQMSVPATSAPVYTLTGVKVAADTKNIKQLPSGVYIVKGKKVLVK